jgi:hypothetical protein
MGLKVERRVGLRIEVSRLEKDRPEDRNPDKAPETPLDEPEPPRVQDPPAEPDPKGPYTVAPHAEHRCHGLSL